ncbi:MAG: hypothetical protein CUN56_12220 [Phototrophicales bacterium]|nr:MAG: hypothetical protein CUN56_12220 [Phototrophicales bacterium]RMG72932.1 MAG: hypothetical protein D6711_11985 [Chloroflexota bacterium]
MIKTVTTMLLLLILILPLAAQEDDDVVTDDEVNAVARQLYCPVCENIPLDACGTAACEDWRYEIRLQLEAGMTEEQIIDDFVTRFGDRVVGTPKDPLLRVISVVTPWVMIALGVFWGWRMFQRRMTTNAVEDVQQVSSDEHSHYQDLLEQDIAGG